MHTASFWSTSVELPTFPPLSEDVNVDVIIIGAGLTGITAAYLFKRAGLTVALVERARCGGVDTSNTTAHISWVTDLRLHRLVNTFGADHALAVWEAGMAALDQIANHVTGLNIDCDFKWIPGYLTAPLDDSRNDIDLLGEDARHAVDLGLRAEFVNRVPHFSLPGVRFWPQASFHPLKYLAALLQTIPGQGSYVFEKTHLQEYQSEPLSVEAHGHTIRGRYLFLATHNPMVGSTSLASATWLQTKLFLYTSYALGAKVPPGLLPEALFWDTADPYHYIRVDHRKGYDYVILGGADHKTGQETDTPGVFRRLERVLDRWINPSEVEHRWSGQVIETNDGLPFIGETAENQFVATGFSGNGMTFGTLAAMMAVDAFFKRKNPWTDLFTPTRRNLIRDPWHYLNENKDYPYYLVRDWVARGESGGLDALNPGQGALMHLEGKKVAAYRDPSGHVTVCSPVCPHLKCIVRWNEAEKSWDCPCHGSRFQPTGEVISGPAEKGLEKIDLEPSSPSDTRK